MMMISGSHRSMAASSRQVSSGRQPRLILAMRQPAGPNNGGRSQQNSNRKHQPFWRPRAAEETASGSKADGSFSDSTPLEVARQALNEEPVDRNSLASSLDTLESEMDRLRVAAQAAESKAQTAEAAAATSKDQLLRLSADFDNYRRRTAADSLSQKDSVRGDVIMTLLPLVDNFELARKQVKAETEQEIKINNSYQSLYKQFVDVFRSLGVEAVPTVGSKFDPEIHEAIMRAPSSEYPDDTVLLEFRKGFRIGEKLLRPATVQVSFNDDAPAPAPDTFEAE